MQECAVAEMAGGSVGYFSTAAPHRGESPNEDSAGLFDLGGGRGVLLVADGVGGHPQGPRASALAVEHMDTALKAVNGKPSLRDAILDGFERANRAILDLGVGAATTLAAIEVRDDLIRPFHAGDSAVLVTGQRGRLKLLTVSHSPVGYAVEAGVISEGEALHHEDRNVVSNLVGSAAMRIELGAELPLDAHDTVVIGTDGLFDNLSTDEIIDIVRAGPIEAAARALREGCERRMNEPRNSEPSKPDDLTFLVYRRA